MGKPILVIGLGVTVLLGGWELMHPAQLAEWSFVGMVALGSSLWWLRSRSSHRLLPFSPITRTQVEQAIAQSREQLTLVAQEAPDLDITNLHQTLDSLVQGFGTTTLTLTLMGAARSGKTTLKALLEKAAIAKDIHWCESAVLSPLEATVLADEPRAIATDLLLFVVTGDLTDADRQTLHYLHQNHHQVFLIFNKQDCYLPQERAEILHQIGARVVDFLAQERIVAIAAAPNPVVVRHHLSDGTIAETRESQTVDISDLTNQLTPILEGDRTPLVLGRLWRQAQQVSWQAQTLLNEARRDRALPIIEKYQWIAAAAAFANPVPTLDLMATAAINAQMIVDLGQLYQQKFSLDQAQTVAGKLGQLMVKLGLMEISSQAIASLLKSHAATYLAGGAIQGVSAAYLTRLAGLSLVTYFAAQSLENAPSSDFNLESFSQKLQQVFALNRSSPFFQGFVDTAIQRLSGKSVIHAGTTP